MKRITWMTAAIALAIPTPILPMSAAAQSNNGVNAELLEFCEELVASGDFPGLNFGECMSFNLTPEPGFQAHFCDFLREGGLYEDYGVTSYSDCIRNLGQ
jgi:hypothetical protein